MSWDLYAQDFPPVDSVEHIPEDFEPEPLGPRVAVIAKILAAMPDVDFSDPSWGLLERDGWSIEFNLGEEEECEDLALHVRGCGRGAMEAVDTVLCAVGVRAIDAQTGEFFTLETAGQSFAAWQAYRDGIVQHPSHDEDDWDDRDDRMDSLHFEQDAPPRKGFFARLFGR